MSVLDDIVAGVREDLARRQADVPEADLRARLARIPIRDEIHPASVSVKRFRDGALTYLGRDWPPLGRDRSADVWADPSLWFHGPITGRRWAGTERSAFDVDVRSTGVGIGDVKYVWEPNRLQILHPLAAGVAQSGTADREAGFALLRSWASVNQPYRGVN